MSILFLNGKYKDEKGTEYSIVEIPLVSNYSYKKPVIDEKKELSEDEKKIVEFSLKNNGRKLVFKELKHLKNDYKHDFDRGTVEYTSLCKNYCFHKVIIPDGATIFESNFSQINPHTQAIIGKNLTFLNCNLVNIELDSSWIVQDCNTSQIKNVKKSEEITLEGRKKIILSHQVEDKDKNFIEVAEITKEVNLGDEYDLLMLRLNGG